MAKNSINKLKPASGWIKTGHQDGKYDTGFDETTERNGKSCACIRSKSDEASGFATLMKMVDAGAHRGHRVRMTVWTKTDGVQNWAGAWMRVDGNSGNSKQPFLAFDNMQDRPIVGTNDWTKHEVVLDVGTQATNIAYGVLLNGPGRVWMDDFQFEIVDDSVALTGQSASPVTDGKGNGKGNGTALQLPSGWIKAGSEPHHYDMGLDDSQHHSGTRCSVIRSNIPEINGFGTLMQTFNASKYKGQRLKLSAWTKTRDVEGWAGVWMRVDGPDSAKSSASYLSFDNMQDRPITGSTDWTSHDVVLDVPEESTNIAFGVLLCGVGTVWMDDFEFQVVDSSTPTTGAGNLRKEPVNLSFES
ncbi:MAG: hypothetical protein JSS86_10430 [Cyanobacteria bacterium SZAS LIN-2]|nr:hypothetical protein [Cyanobacteria bacterium SZAS LIN-2]